MQGQPRAGSDGTSSLAPKEAKNQNEDAKRITNATKRAKSAIASERAKPKMAYPKSCFESVGLRDTE